MSKCGLKMTPFEHAILRSDLSGLTYLPKLIRRGQAGAAVPLLRVSASQGLCGKLDSRCAI